MAVYSGDFSGMIPKGAGNPGVECDEDGTVTVRWVAPGHRESFSLTILPSGKLVATKAALPLVPEREVKR